MHLIYFAHSYKHPEINEFFQELMLSEEMMPSLDPWSDRLNSAKPERHLRSTDGMIAVLPYREPMSAYIPYEIALSIRAHKPLLVFVEDVLPNGLFPPSVMQRRFSRRGLLRQVREHRHALRLLKTYIGSEPPPPYQPSIDQRTCLIIGGSLLSGKQENWIADFLTDRRYAACVAPQGADLLAYDHPHEELVARSVLCISFAEELTPTEYYILGAARAVLTPLIVVTRNREYAFTPGVPEEYQPKLVEPARDHLYQVLAREVEIFEEDYLELKEQDKVKLYRDVQIHGHQRPREDVMQVVIQGGSIDMSRDKIQVSNVVGPVNIKSRLDHVTQTIQTAPGLAEDRRSDLAQLVKELEEALKTVTEQRADDAAQVTRAAEMVAAEATKKEPRKSMLSISASGLVEAANALKDIAPTVLVVARKVALFVAGLA